MPYNGTTGAFSRLYDWTDDRDAAIKIRADRFDEEMDGFATGLSTAICKDGQTTPTANLPMGGFRHTGVGAGSSLTHYLRVSEAVVNDPAYAASVGGTGDAITVTTGLPPTSLAAGQRLSFVVGAANTGAVTIDRDGLGAKNFYANNAAMSANELLVGDLVTAIYDGTRWHKTSSVRNVALDAELTAIAGLTSAADMAPYFTGSGTAALATLTAFGRSLIDDADSSTARTTLGLVIGTNVQAYDATLASIAALGTAADKLAYTTGIDTWAEAAITSFGRSLIDDAAASNARTTLGLGTSAVVDTGTSGTKVALTDGANTWSGAQTFSALGTFNAGINIATPMTSPGGTEAGYMGVGTPVTKDASYTYGLADRGILYRHTDGTGRAWTIPPNSSVAFPLGTVLPGRNVGSGAVTLTRGSGVALRIAGSTTDQNVTCAQWAMWTAVKEAADTWVVSGTGLS